MDVKYSEFTKSDVGSYHWYHTLTGKLQTFEIFLLTGFQIPKEEFKTVVAELVSGYDYIVKMSQEEQLKTDKDE